MSNFYWIAHYPDGSVTDQRQSSYRNIDREALTAFGLYRYSDHSPVVMIDFRDDAGGKPEIGPKRLIWRIRHQKNTLGEEVSVHLAGWQRTICGVQVQAITYVNEDGTVILGGQWVENQPLTHAIVPLEFERDLIC